MAAQWVNYKEVRRQVDFDHVLAGYDVEVKTKGDQRQGFCPLPAHQGKRRSPSFSVNVKKNIWQCFGCGARGNVIDFVALMEGLDPEEPDEFRKAALIIQDRFLDPQVQGSSAVQVETEDLGETPTADEGMDDAPRVINAPLDFELKHLDPTHPYLRERGLEPEAIECFGLGYCSKGLMAGRIAIPLHDPTGRLIGYAGRLADDSQIAEDKPKYLFPGSRERDGTVHQFQKSAFLFNGFRLEKPVDALVVVEGFFGLFCLWQNGYRNVVALMGSACSQEQGSLIVDLVGQSGKVWVMPDGDEAGGRCAEEVFREVGAKRFVRWARLEPGEQPDDCRAGRLAELLVM